MVVVHCRNCDTRFETSSPRESVDWVRRCPVCGLRHLETLDDEDGLGADLGDRRAAGRPLHGLGEDRP